MKKIIILLSIMFGMSFIPDLNIYASNNTHIEEAETSLTKKRCSSCRGTGYVTCARYTTCRSCNGAGKFLRTSSGAKSGVSIKSYKTCATCRGTGKIKCSLCEGSGKRVCRACYGRGEL